MTAASAAEALDLVQTTPVNLLLADIAMPDEDGYGLIRTIRALPSPRQAAIPAAALTSFARGEDRQQAIQAGFQLHERLAARPTREEMLSRLHSRRRVTLKTAASTVIREERESA